MGLSNIILMAVLGLFSTSTLGQQLSYTTFAVTECFSLTSQGGAQSSPPPQAMVTQGMPQGAVAFSMPACAVCNCPTCTLTSTYTTMYSIFCPTGLMDQTYTITETYVGISSLPSFAKPTEIPLGFVTAVETCTQCGPRPITATMTYPVTARPYLVETAKTVTATLPPAVTEIIETSPLPTSPLPASPSLTTVMASIVTEVIVTAQRNNSTPSFSTELGNKMPEGPSTTAVGTTNSTIITPFVAGAGSLEGSVGLVVMILMLAIL